MRNRNRVKVTMAARGRLAHNAGTGNDCRNETKRTRREGETREMDATRVLVAQHRAIESLFDEVEHETRRRGRASAVARLAEELIAHLAAEEAVFYPAARLVLDGGANATEQARSEHLLLRIELRRVLETSVTDESFGERIGSLRGIFADHVKNEEVEVFPRVACALPVAELEILGAEILASRPPVWIVTTEGRALVQSDGEWALRGSVSLPIPPGRDS
jgi:hemerythrin superfamily protein